MRKRHLFWIIPSSVIVLLLLISLFGHLFSPIKTKKNVTKSKCLNNLTPKQQDEDLAYLKYYLQNVYINYDQMAANGFDIDKVIEDIKADYKRNLRNDGSIGSQEFFNSLRKIMFQNFNVVDKHFNIGGTWLLDNQFYFSNIYIKEQKTSSSIKYIVVKNEAETFPDYIKKSYANIGTAEINPGQEYTGSKDNLYEWFDGNEKIYRFGLMSKGEINFAYIQIDGKPVKAPVIATWYLHNNKAQGFTETNDTLYLSLRDFMFEQSSSSELVSKNRKEFEKLCNNAKDKTAGKANIIIDLRSNGGGQTIRSAMLLSKLFYDEKDVSPELSQYLINLVHDDYTLYSPATGAEYRRNMIYNVKDFFKTLKNKNKDNEYDEYTEIVYKKWHRTNYLNGILELFVPYRKEVKFPYAKTSITELPKPTFSGNIYVLTDNNSASCSEYTIALLHNMIKGTDINVCQIGFNTNGAVFYFNPWSFVFPNTGYTITFPTAINKSNAFNFPNFKGEGYGWYPDYWCTNQNMINTLVNLTGDKDLEIVLTGLEKSQL